MPPLFFLEDLGDESELTCGILGRETSPLVSAVELLIDTLTNLCFDGEVLARARFIIICSTGIFIIVN